MHYFMKMFAYSLNFLITDDEAQDYTYRFSVHSEYNNLEFPFSISSQDDGLEFQDVQVHDELEKRMENHTDER